MESHVPSSTPTAPPAPPPPLPPPQPPVQKTTESKCFDLFKVLNFHEKPDSNPIEIKLPQEVKGKKKLRFVVMSDTHNHHDRLKVPEGDVFLHCGDMSDCGTPEELAQFNDFLGKLNHKYKIVICGNHEKGFASYDSCQIHKLFFSNATHYLHDSHIVIDGIKIYGTPYVPNMSSFHGERNIMKFYDNTCFYRNDEFLEKCWNNIPGDTNILMTHTPPRGIMDGVRQYGCPLLRKRLTDLKQLKVHCFGHVHMGYGHKEQDGVMFVNAALDECEQPFYFDYYYDHVNENVDC